VNLLVLFDIDGTLVLTGRAGVRGMNLAFSRLYGRDGALDRVPIAGRTDRAIVADAMRGLGLEPTSDAIAALRDAYIEHLQAEIGRSIPGHPSLVLPGVLPLIDALAAVPGITVALLTGNFERGAMVKLGHFDLWDRFAWGAFGDDHEDRRALVPVALQRGEAAGTRVASPEAIVIIGDTPHDIDCARAHGARAIGVATGPFGRPALEAAGADLAVDTLEPLDLVMDWLTASREPSASGLPAEAASGASD
jgi:phosphoglycolate phosphatase-like HAD superfamily hydrolase